MRGQGAPLDDQFARGVFTQIVVVSACKVWTERSRIVSQLQRRKNGAKLPVLPASKGDFRSPHFVGGQGGVRSVVLHLKLPLPACPTKWGKGVESSPPPFHGGPRGVFGARLLKLGSAQSGSGDSALFHFRCDPAETDTDADPDTRRSDREIPPCPPAAGVRRQTFDRRFLRELHQRINPCRRRRTRDFKSAQQKLVEQRTPFHRLRAAAFHEAHGLGRIQTEGRRDLRSCRAGRRADCSSGKRDG